MKKIIIIYTSLLITIFGLGSFLIYSYYLSSYKNAYQSYVKNNESNISTTKILINPCQLYTNSKTILWEDENKEIIKDGILYDIISIISDKGKVVLTVISDYQEQIIKKEFASVYNIHSTKSDNNPLKLLKQFLSLKFLINSNSLFDFESIQCNSTIYTNYLFSIKSIFLSKNTPPPNILM